MRKNASRVSETHTTEYPRLSIDAMVETGFRGGMGSISGDIAAWLRPWITDTERKHFLVVAGGSPQGLKLFTRRLTRHHQQRRRLGERPRF